MSYRVKIKENIDDIEFVKDCGLKTDIVYPANKKDNGTYEICGFHLKKKN